jgi:hypothetical protein
VVEVALVAHEVGEIVAAVLAVDDDRLAAHGAVEGLPYRGNRRLPDRRGQRGGDLAGRNDENARDGQLDEFVQHLGDRGAGLSHPDIGDFLQGVFLILIQHGGVPVRIP